MRPEFRVWDKVPLVSDVNNCSQPTVIQNKTNVSCIPFHNIPHNSVSVLRNGDVLSPLYALRTLTDHHAFFFSPVVYWILITVQDHHPFRRQYCIRSYALCGTLWMRHSTSLLHELYFPSFSLMEGYEMLNICTPCTQSPCCAALRRAYLFSQWPLVMYQKTLSRCPLIWRWKRLNIAPSVSLGISCVSGP